MSVFCQIRWCKSRPVVFLPLGVVVLAVLLLLPRLTIGVRQTVAGGSRWRQTTDEQQRRESNDHVGILKQPGQLLAPAAASEKTQDEVASKPKDAEDEEGSRPDAAVASRQRQFNDGSNRTDDRSAVVVPSLLTERTKEEGLEVTKSDIPMLVIGCLVLAFGVALATYCSLHAVGMIRGSSAGHTQGGLSNDKFCVPSSTTTSSAALPADEEDHHHHQNNGNSSNKGVSSKAARRGGGEGGGSIHVHFAENDSVTSSASGSTPEDAMSSSPKTTFSEGATPKTSFSEVATPKTSFSGDSAQEVALMTTKVATTASRKTLLSPRPDQPRMSLTSTLTAARKRAEGAEAEIHEKVGGLSKADAVAAPAGEQRDIAELDNRHRQPGAVANLAAQVERRSTADVLGSSPRRRSREEKAAVRRAGTLLRTLAAADMPDETNSSEPQTSGNSPAPDDSDPSKETTTHTPERISEKRQQPGVLGERRRPGASSDDDPSQDPGAPGGWNSWGEFEPPGSGSATSGISHATPKIPEEEIVIGTAEEGEQQQRHAG